MSLTILWYYCLLCAVKSQVQCNTCQPCCNIVYVYFLELKPLLLASKTLREAVQELALHENDTLQLKAQDILSLLCV